MTEYNVDNDGAQRHQHQPTLNVPRIIVVLLACFIAVHLFRTFAGKEWDHWLILHFAFTPARLSSASEFVGLNFPGGGLGDAWTFVTHAFLHADWEHLVFNCIWMLVFGSVIARRLKTARFLIFAAYGAAFGAIGHYMYNFGSLTFLIGASGAISGMMGGAVRLIYSIEGGFSNLRRGDFNDVALMPLTQVVQNKSAMMFVGVWVVFNIVFGAVGFGTGETVARIAWEAHLGGFLAGFVLLGLFDPVSGKRSLFSKSR